MTDDTYPRRYRIHRRWSAVSVIAAVALTAGCASTTYRPVGDDTNGVRYYAGATYVLVKPDYANGKANVTFLTLPDTTKTYAVDTYSWMASNVTTIDFKDGMISKASSEVNSVAVPKAIVEASAAVAQQALAAAASKAALLASGAMERTNTVGPADEGIYLYHSDGTTLTQVYP